LNFGKKGRGEKREKRRERKADSARYSLDLLDQNQASRILNKTDGARQVAT
jgi:hypothetical protein